MGRFSDLTVRISGQADGFKRAMAEVNRDLATSAKNVAASTGGYRTFGASLSALSTPLTVASAAIAGLGFAALDTAGDFESSFSRIRANIDGVTGPALEGLRAQALELGADTAFSAQQAADAMVVFGSAGFKASQVMAALPGTLDLAAAGALAVGDAATLTKDILGQFNLQASQSGHVADVLAQASKDTSASLSEMGVTLTYVGPAAKGAGQGLEETVASIIALDAAGIRGEKAGTGLRGVLASLLAPSTEAKEAMDGLGIKISDNVGKILPLSNIMEQFRTKLKGVGSEAEKQRVFFTVFGREAGNTAQILANAGAASLDAFEDKLKNSAGAAQILAKTLNSGLKYSLDQMKGSLNTAAIELGTSLIPASRKLIGIFTELVNEAVIPAVRSFGALPEPVQTAAISFAALAAAAGPVTLGLGAFAQSSLAIVSVATSIGTVLGRVLPIVDTFKVLTGSIAGPMTAAQAAAAGFAATLSGPLVVAIAGVVAYKLSEWLYDNSTRFKDFIDWTNQANKAVGGLYVAMTGKPQATVADVFRASLVLLKAALDENAAATRGLWDTLLNDRSKQAAVNINTFAAAIGRMSAAAAASQSLQNGAAGAALSFDQAVAEAVKSIQDGETRTAAYNEALKRLGKTHGDIKPPIEKANRAVQQTAEQILAGIAAFEKWIPASAAAVEQLKLAGRQAKELAEKGYITIFTDDAVEAFLKLGEQSAKTVDKLLVLNTTLATPPPPPRKVPSAMPIPQLEKDTQKAVSISERFSRQVSLITNDLARDMTDLIFKGGKFKDVVSGAFENIGKSIARAAIEGQLQRIAKLFTGLITDGGTLGKVLGAVFNVPVAKSATDAPSVIKNAAAGASPAGGGAGAATGVASGLAGTVTAIASVGTLISSVIGNFQFAGMNKSLDLIVNHTLRTANQLIEGLQPQINTYLPYLQSIHDRLQTVVDRGIGVYDAAMGGGAARSGGGGPQVINNYFQLEGTDPYALANQITRIMKLQAAV